MDINSQIPKWAQQYFSLDDLKQISSYIEIAEKKTDGEIIPMIVEKSFTSSLSLNLVLLVVLGVMGVNYYFLPLDYQSLLNIFYFILIGLFFVVLRFDGFQKLVLQKSYLRRMVENRAELEFYRGQYTSTKDRTGILIFISLYEKQVVVLGDKAISAKLKQGDWQNLVTNLLEKIKENKMPLGLVNAITECGEILASHFPKSEGNENEISNHLVFK